MLNNIPIIFGSVFVSCISDCKPVLCWEGMLNDLLLRYKVNIESESFFIWCNTSLDLTPLSFQTGCSSATENSQTTSRTWPLTIIRVLPTMLLHFECLASNSSFSYLISPISISFCKSYRTSKNTVFKKIKVLFGVWSILTPSVYFSTESMMTLS